MSIHVDNLETTDFVIQQTDDAAMSSQVYNLKTNTVVASKLFSVS